MRYRITKYNPKDRDEQGRYLKEEWTSLCDIGQVYEGKRFSNKEYLYIEDQYLIALFIIAIEKEASHFKITSFEQKSLLRENEKWLSSYGIKLSDSEKLCFDYIENDILDLYSSLMMCKLVLRECAWCILEDASNKENMRIEFGWDYYMYVTCKSVSDDTIKKIERIGMFIEGMD